MAGERIFNIDEDQTGLSPEMRQALLDDAVSGRLPREDLKEGRRDRAIEVTDELPENTTEAALKFGRVSTQAVRDIKEEPKPKHIHRSEPIPIETTAKRNTPHISEIIAGTPNPNRPRPGANIFLLLNIAAIKPGAEPDLGKTKEDVLKELQLLNSTSDFHISVDDYGWLTVIANNERATNVLGTTMMAINSIWPESTILMESGLTEHTRDSYNLRGKPDTRALEISSEDGPGMYFLENLDQTTDNPNSREASLSRIKKGALTEHGLRRIDNISPRPENVGGPDEFIGNRGKLTELEEALKDQSVHFITVEGVRGIGKSRLIRTGLANYPGCSMEASIDSSDRKNPGGGLVRFAKAIMHADEKMGYGLAMEIKTFFERNNTPAKQIESARTEPDKLVEMCKNTLELIHLVDENAVLDLRDLHNIDFFSQPFMRRVVRETYVKEDAKGKVLTSFRPEDLSIDTPEIQEQLEADFTGYYGKGGFKKITLSNLDMQQIDPDTGETLGYEYVYHSLDPEERTGKTLGKWQEILARVSGGHPFVATYLIDGVLEGGKLTTSAEGVINLPREDIEAIRRVENTGNPINDLAIHFEQRLERLSPEAKKTFQAMAICGGRLNDVQLNKLISKVEGPTSTIIPQLQKGRYILGSPEEGWRLESELVTELANRSVSDRRERHSMVESLLYTFREDLSIGPILRFELANGPKPPEQDDPFWPAFAADVQTALIKLQAEKAYGESYDYTRRLVGRRLIKKETEEEKQKRKGNEEETIDKIAKDQDRLEVSGGLPDIKNAIEVMKLGIETAPGLRKLAASALLATAKSGMYLARFDEARLALAELQAIIEANPQDETIESVATGSKVNQIAFEQGYRSRDKDSLTRLLGFIEADESISHAGKVLARMRVAYTAPRDDAEFRRIYDSEAIELITADITHQTEQGGRPSEEVTEIRRLKLLADFVAFSEQAKVRGHLTVDDDVDHRPEIVSDDMVGELDRLHAETNKLFALNDKFPTLYDPNAIVNLASIVAELETYLGDFGAATEKLRHAHRFATNMEVYDPAARAVKQLCDAYLASGDPQGALQVHDRLGKVAMSVLDDSNFSKWVMWVDQIHYTAVLGESMDLSMDFEHLGPMERITKRSELRPHIAAAFANYIKLNELSKTVPGIRSTDAAYYLGNIGIVLLLASKLGLPIPGEIFDQEQCPLFSKEYILEGMAQAERMTDLELGGTRKEVTVEEETKIIGMSEKELKVKGLSYLLVAETKIRAVQAAATAKPAPAPEA